MTGCLFAPDGFDFTLSALFFHSQDWLATFLLVWPVDDRCAWVSVVRTLCTSSLTALAIAPGDGDAIGDRIEAELPQVFCDLRNFAGESMLGPPRESLDSVVNNMGGTAKFADFGDPARPVDLAGLILAWQGRLAPLRARLLPSLSSRRATRTTDRLGDEPCRFSLRPPCADVTTHRCWVIGGQPVLLAAALSILLEACGTTPTPPEPPSGRIELNQTPLTLTSGESTGVLYFQGRARQFIISGLGVGGEGIAPLQTTSEAYHIGDFARFAGIYRQAPPQSVPNPKVGGLWLENSNGVLLHIQPPQGGRILPIGSDAVPIQTPQ
jgi:hypothetical protein